MPVVMNTARVSPMRAYLEDMDKAGAIAPPLDEPLPIVLAA